jgi:hypothetical protein
MLYKTRYVPVAEVPVFFYLKSTSTTLHVINGFRHIRVATPMGVKYFVARGERIWLAKESI